MEDSAMDGYPLPPSHTVQTHQVPRPEQHPPEDAQDEYRPPTQTGITQKDQARFPAGIERGNHDRRFGTNSNTR